MPTLTTAEVGVLKRACAAYETDAEAVASELPWFADFLTRVCANRPNNGGAASKDGGDGDDGDDGSEEEEEEAPPPAPPPDPCPPRHFGCSAGDDARACAASGQRLLEGGAFAEAERCVSAALEKNPNSVRALRVRGHARLRLCNYEGAVSDLSLAQSIDYDAEMNALHAEAMRLRQLRASQHGTAARDAAAAVPPPPPPPPPPMAGLGLDQLDLAALMQNPQLMHMAEKVMQDPQALASIQKLVGGSIASSSPPDPDAP